MNAKLNFDTCTCGHPRYAHGPDGCFHPQCEVLMVQFLERGETDREPCFDFELDVQLKIGQAYGGGAEAETECFAARSFASWVIQIFFMLLPTDDHPLEYTAVVYDRLVTRE